MKKYILGVAVVTLLSFFFAFNTQNIHAQEKVIKTDTPIGVDTTTTESGTLQSVNYELPYPGMLPDNPLYFLKMIRDAVMKFLINDPFKKAQFSLLNADKRMYAGKMLNDKGEVQLAVETIAKSNNYFDDAVSAIESARRSDPKNPDIQAFLSQFKTSTLKHHEIIEKIKSTIDKKFLARLTNEENRVDMTTKTVEALIHNK